LPGVIDVVKLPAGVAVVADAMERALAARDALEVKWTGIAGAERYNSETVLEKDYAAIAADPNAERATLDKKGDDQAAFAGAARTFEKTYRSDYAYHAQMEPLNAVARFNADGTLEVWEGTQAPGISRNMIARSLGLDRSKVIHHQRYLGGGFGRRSLSDYTVEAARIARRVKRPVKMIWTREEDIAHGMFRPQALLCMECALDRAGKVVGWRQCVVGDGGRLLQSGIKIPYYRIANQHIERRGASHNIRLKHWRAVAHPFNVFAHEAFIDEMAEAAGFDPLAFRRRHMSMTSKASAVFDHVAGMSDWTARRPDGRAIGLSISERSGSLGAGVAEISLDRATGVIRVHKVWVAVDAGIVVQPEAARRNVESGIIYGLSSVLKERATIRDGAVEQSNFHDYQVLRMSEAPDELHVAFLDRDTKPTGIGEIGNPFIAAAVANAFHKLTGKRLYHMPFTPERVLAALNA
jgi:isoquinoline 1-oxidoreductase beta subunit